MKRTDRYWAKHTCVHTFYFYPEFPSGIAIDFQSYWFVRPHFPLSFWKFSSSLPCYPLIWGKQNNNKPSLSLLPYFQTLQSIILQGIRSPYPLVDNGILMKFGDWAEKLAVAHPCETPFQRTLLVSSLLTWHDLFILF